MFGATHSLLASKVKRDRQVCLWYQIVLCRNVKGAAEIAVQIPTRRHTKSRAVSGPFSSLILTILWVCAPITPKLYKITVAGHGEDEQWSRSIRRPGQLKEYEQPADQRPRARRALNHFCVVLFRSSRGRRTVLSLAQGP